MLSIDFIKLAWVSGTPLGRLVVPEVCRNSATSSSEGGFGSEDLVQGLPFSSSTSDPLSRDVSTTVMPSSFAASRPL